MMRFLILLISVYLLNLNLNAQEEFSGTIDLSGTFWVRMMGYPPDVPKWIKCATGIPGTRTTQGFNQSGDIYRQNLNGTMGAFFPASKIFRVESDLIRPSISGYKIQVLVIRDSRFQGKNVKPIDHQIYPVYNSNQNSTVPMSGEYIIIEDLVGGGSHYNYLRSHTGSTEIILYDRKHGNPVYAGSGATNIGSYDSYGTWVKGTPIITNWKGTNEPHVTADKYEYDPKYTKYKSQTFNNPEEGRTDDNYIPKPDRIGDGQNDILGDLANIEDVEGCIELTPLEPVTWNIDTYINEVSDVITAKYDLTFFETSITERSLPDFSFEWNINEEPQTFEFVTDGKLNAGAQTETIDNFFSLARAIILIFVSLYAVTHLFSILRR